MALGIRVSIYELAAGGGGGGEWRVEERQGTDMQSIPGSNPESNPYLDSADFQFLGCKRRLIMAPAPWVPGKIK